MGPDQVLAFLRRAPAFAAVELAPMLNVSVADLAPMLDTLERSGRATRQGELWWPSALLAAYDRP